MAILPLQLARVSNSLRTNVATSQMARTQQKLMEIQNQLSTGFKVNAPSDDPGNSAIIQALQKTLEQRAGYATNLKQAQSQLSETDSAMGDLTELLQQAQTIASANVGSDVTPEARSNAATIIDSLYSQALSLANKQFDGVYIFGGDKSTSAPYVSEQGGIRFIGSNTVLTNAYDENSTSAFMVDAQSIFGALSTRNLGATDLGPAVSSTTRLSDLNGASGDGVNRGAITINNGTTSAVIDLTKADTLGDVVTTINASGLSGVTASLTSSGLTLTAGTGADLTVTEMGGGSTARDLGIRTLTGGGAGVNIVGGNLAAKVTPLTSITALKGGAGIDTTGFKITNGSQSATIDFTGVTTVEGLINQINGAKVGVTAQINADGSGITLANNSQGTDMTISEIGGTTAADLGIRSFNATDRVATLNNGKGLHLASGADLTITRKDGTSFDVDLNSAVTVQDVIDAINTADGGAGMTASFATNGNGIILTDSTGGSGSMGVISANGSTAAKDLGLDSVPSGTTITGKDVNPVGVSGVFANLARLAQGLRSSDAATITTSAENLKVDYDRVVRERGKTGAKVQELETRQDRMEDQNVATKSLLSQLHDTDFTDAITQFQNLQNTLQASLQTTASILNLSLLDYIG